MPDIVHLYWGFRIECQLEHQVAKTVKYIISLLQVVDWPEVLLILIIQALIKSFILKNIFHVTLLPPQIPIKLLFLLDHFYLVVVINKILWYLVYNKVLAEGLRDLVNLHQPIQMILRLANDPDTFEPFGLSLPKDFKLSWIHSEFILSGIVLQELFHNELILYYRFIDMFWWLMRFVSFMILEIIVSDALGYIWRWDIKLRVTSKLFIKFAISSFKLRFILQLMLLKWFYLNRELHLCTNCIITVHLGFHLDDFGFSTLHRLRSIIDLCEALLQLPFHL